MAYFIASLSYEAKYRPSFKLLNVDGSEYSFKTSHYPLDGLRRGEPISSAEASFSEKLCHNAIISSAHRKLPDIFYVASELCISQALKDIVESFEPDTHEFFQINLMRKNNECFDGGYYHINICQICDSLVFDKSNLIFVKPDDFSGGSSGHISRKGGFNDYRTLRMADNAGKHLWREKLYLDDIYMSDSLHYACEKLKISGLQSRVCKKTTDE